MATEAEAEDVVQTLLTHGVEVNAKTIPYDPCGPKSGGITALHIASCRGDERITQLLIDNGADVIARSAAQVSPLEEAIKHSSVDVVRILIQNGATEDISPCGWTPLHEVASSTKVGSIEIAADRLEMVRLLLNHGEDVEARTHGTRKTPLTVAAIAGHVEMAQLLLDRGADLTAQARCGLTVLHFAASYGHVQMVQWLLDAGTEMEVTDYRGVTALQLAALQGKTTIIELLLERGADVTARNNRGHNALSMARQQSQHTAIKTLERYYGQHSMEVPEFAGITTPDAVYWIDL